MTTCTYNVYNVLSILQASGEAQYVSDMIVSNALAAAFVLSTEVHMMCNNVCIICHVIGLLNVTCVLHYG